MVNAVTDRDSFLRGYLLGKVLKLPHSDRPAQVPLSAASGTYDKNSFLSGLAAALCASGAGLSGTWNALHSQFVTFPQWAAYFRFIPVESDFTLIHADGQSSFEMTMPFVRSRLHAFFRVSTNREGEWMSFYSDSTLPARVNSDNKNMLRFEEEGRKILWSNWELPYSWGGVDMVGAAYETIAPVDGYYTRKEGVPFARGQYTLSNGTIYPISENWSADTRRYLLKGLTIAYSDSRTQDFQEACVSGFAQLFPPVMIVTPAGPEAELSSQSRPGNVSGDYGIARADGTISRIWTGQIIRENPDGGIFYNPVTNQERVFSNWSYDYTARVYALTIDGDSVTITYGDSFLTIQQGGQTYRLAYAIRS